MFSIVPTGRKFFVFLTRQCNWRAILGRPSRTSDSDMTI